MKVWWLLGLFIAVCGHAAPFVDRATGLTFPDESAGWTRINARTFDKASLGFSVGYNRKPGETLTAYVYDLGVREIPDGGESEAVTGQITAIGVDLKSVWEEKGGRVEEVMPPVVISERLGGATSAMIMAHRIAFSREVLSSISGVTGWRGKFLKIRYTFPGEDLEAGLDDLRAWLDTVVAANGLTMADVFAAPRGEAPSLAPSDEPTEAPTETPSREEALAAMSTLEQRLLTPEAAEAAQIVTRFVEKSEDVMVTLGPRTVPWMTEDGESNVDSSVSALLLAVYFAGNARAQLEAGRAVDDPVAGWRAVIRAYREIQTRVPLRIASIDRLARLEAEGRLEAPGELSDELEGPRTL